MTLIRIEAKGQITLPAEISTQAGIKDGDWMVMTVERDRIILRSLSLPASTPSALKRIRAEAKRKGIDRVTMRRIEEEIRTYRNHRRRG